MKRQIRKSGLSVRRIKRIVMLTGLAVCLSLVVMLLFNRFYVDVQQSLYMLCYPKERSSESASLYQYHIARNEWTPILVGRLFSQAFALPDDSGLILTEEINETKQTILWHGPGEEKFLFGGEHSAKRAMSPDGRVLVLTSELYSNRSKLLYLDACDPTGCEIDIVPGYPHWSPDGQQTVIETRNTVWLRESNPLRVESRPGLYLGNKNGIAQSVFASGLGYSRLAWITDNRFIFVLQDFDKPLGYSDTLYEAHVDGSITKKIISVEELWDASYREVDYYFLISEVFPNVTDESEFFIITTASRVGEVLTRFFSYNSENGNVRLLLESYDYMLFEPATKGRWSLALITPQHQTWEAAIISLQDKTSQIYELGDIFFLDKDWSLEGTDLIVLAKEQFFVIKPESESILSLNYPEQFYLCSAAVWGP